MAETVLLTDSILRTIAKMVDADGLEGNDHYFDEDLLIHINTAIFELYQVGVGEKGYYVTGETETWSDFLGEDAAYLQSVKDYIYLYTKPIFDPSGSATVQQTYKDVADRLLYRIREQVACTETL